MKNQLMLIIEDAAIQSKCKMQPSLISREKLTSHEKADDAHGKCHQHDDGQLQKEQTSED